MNEVDKKNAKILYDYHRINKPAREADLLLVLGGHDLRVPEYAADLYKKGLVSHVVTSGGIAHAGDLLETGWDQTEAEIFAEKMIEHGVPKEVILLEKEAHNTGQNFEFTRKLFDQKGIKINSILAVTKPYMERRAFATGKVQWPDVELTLSSPQLTFDEYLNRPIDADNVVNIMVGDLQRIIEYPKLGYQIEQEVPDEVMQAYQALIESGYDKHLIKD